MISCFACKQLHWLACKHLQVCDEGSPELLSSLLGSSSYECMSRVKPEGSYVQCLPGLTFAQNHQGQAKSAFHSSIWLSDTVQMLHCNWPCGVLDMHPMLYSCPNTSSLCLARHMIALQQLCSMCREHCMRGITQIEIDDRNLATLHECLEVV